MKVDDRTGYELAHAAFWAAPEAERLAAFARIRAGEATHHFRIPQAPLFRDGRPDAYALVSHAEVSEASRRADLFSNEPSANALLDLPRFMATTFGSMINMDDPRHAHIRKIVARSFTPKVLAKTEEDLRRRAAAIVDEILADGPTDFVTQVAARLPTEVICDMLGIPESYRANILPWTNHILGFGDAEYNGGVTRLNGDARLIDSLRTSKVIMGAGLRLYRLANKLAKERVRRPTDDVTSLLVAAQGEENLTAQEFGSFFVLLVVAGNETTRNALSHAVHLFTGHPDQLELLMADFEGRIGGAVEEIVRYSTPVIQFRRDVTEDCSFHGHEYRAGDKVVLFYNSANRDETVFPDPDRFDITRSPNPHVGFGGPGPHYCLGAHLARRELTVMLRELYTRMPGLRTVGEPERLCSYFINGIKHMTYQY
ncbi:methyl-branched lipid omega-hydroxylase Cyp124 [Pseudonocardia eucalypti]|uniref:Methyl-branched lipid omega-hydroxylase Cyp124 n=1 Tax=Pseudonocardia eucalypti TaxID=648755 RepID=A0ABP9R026_9PSEU|nr:cytochrome P450 [Pseudonocardia eucalypti]